MPVWKKNKEENTQPIESHESPESNELPPGLSNIRHIVAVASGKGGVGKSTVATNLAVALAKKGHTVGLMDADIYGPSQPGMLGAKDALPKARGNDIIPVEKHGIRFMSLGLLTGNDSPVVWRAPIATRVIQQFLGNVHWGKLDFLLIDLPPGTGDIHLTLSQQATLSGAVIVTTPQQVALGIAQKGLKMFDQVNIPILGIIENMSGFCCPNCNHVTHVFKGGGGHEMAVGLEVPFLGSIPLDPAIMTAGDLGVPVVLNQPDSEPALAFQKIANQLESQMDALQEVANHIQPEKYVINEEGQVELSWKDGLVASFDPFSLRANCRCAVCVDENTGRKILNPATLPLDIQVESIRTIGRYALAFQFSDGHKTGIYKFELLRKLKEELASPQAFSV